jgi:hypothetical protein
LMATQSSSMAQSILLAPSSSPIKLNGAIYITCTILKFVAASAAEAE